MDTLLLYGAGSTVGPDAAYTSISPLLLEAQGIAAPQYVAPAAASAAPTVGGGAALPVVAGVDPTRVAALMQGAAPATDAERTWVGKVGQAYQGYIATVTSIVAEGRRQAALGRDLQGRPIGGREDHAWEQRVLDLVNAERAKGGLSALSYDAQLDAAAEGHNARQAITHTMAHDGIGDGDPGSRIRATGFTGAWGENVATGQLSPEQVVAEWMASPGHRRNIMDPEFARLGVSVGVDTAGRTYWAQSFGA